MTEFKTTKPLERLADAIRQSEALQKETGTKLGCDVLFTVNRGKESVKWLLRGKGDASKVELVKADDGVDSADVVVRVDDANLSKLIRGKSSAQKLFMMGKLKIKGNVMKAAYIETLLKHAESSKL